MDKVVHFEIPVDDLARAKKFYQSMFGWQMNDVPGMKDYTLANTVPVDANNMIKEPGAINGGLGKRSPKGDMPVLVIQVPSVDDYLKKLTKAGSKIVQPKQKVMEIGLYARVTDTEGNIIGIWENIRK